MEDESCPPCCRAGRGQGYCTVYRQLMPQSLQLLCECNPASGATPEECLRARRTWDRDGGPLGLHRPVRTGLCSYLGAWTGNFCPD